MAIHQTHKQTAAFAKSYGEPRSQSERDLEKRLRILRQQVYGKLEVGSENQEIPLQHPTFSLREASHISPLTSDITYLRHDLLKISLLTSLAFGIQLIIFYLLQNGFINLKFF